MPSATDKRMTVTRQLQRSASPTLVREVNSNLVLDVIRMGEPVSRAQIARQIKLSPAAVTRIVKNLVEQNLVLEIGDGESSGGRRPTLLRVNSRGGYIIGVELDILEISIVLVDLDGNIKSIVKIPTHAEKSPDEVLQSLVVAINELVDDFEDNGGSKKRIIAIGMAVAGGVDYKSGEMVLSANLGRRWRHVPLKAVIGEACGLDVFIEELPKAMAIGEHRFGTAQDTNNLVCLYVGGGLGVGVVADGKIYRGVTGNPGEFCHLAIVKDGPLCSCGNRGCLETMVAEVGTIRRVREAIRTGTKTIIRDLVDNDLERLNVGYIFEAASQGDKFAVHIREEMVYYLSLAVSIAFTSYDPGVIVVGGHVIDQGGDALLALIKAGAAEKILKERRARLHIRKSIMGDSAGAISAAALVFPKAFNVSLAHA